LAVVKHINTFIIITVIIIMWENIWHISVYKKKEHKTKWEVITGRPEHAWKDNVETGVT
jgi:hypothetical protein